MKSMNAKYTGRCALCEATITKGEAIGYDRARGGAMHVACVNKRIRSLVEALDKKGVTVWNPEEKVGYTFTSEIDTRREFMTSRKNPTGAVGSPTGRDVAQSFWTLEDVENIYRAFLPDYACEFTTISDQYYEAN